MKGYLYRGSIILSCCTLVSTLSLAAEPSTTEPSAVATKTRVEALSMAGTEAYREKRYRDAIGHYSAALVIFEAPGLLFNLGRCHEALEEWRAAEEHYTRAAQAPKASAAVRQRGTERAAHARAQQVKPMAPTQLTPLTSKPEGPVQPVTPSDDGTLDTLAWTAVGVGGLSIVGGGLILYLGISDHDTLADARGGQQLSRIEALELRDQGDDRKSLGGTLIAVGGVVAVSALFLLKVSVTPKASTVQVGVTPNGLSMGFEF